MHNNDDLFDKKVREKLNKEINDIPDNINKSFDKAINKIERRRNFKKVSGICAAVIAGTLIIGTTMPTYASEIPIIGNIFKIFKSDVFKNYDKYSSDLNVTKESNGLKVTINKVVYDGIELTLFYTIESQEPMKDVPRFVEPEIKINGKKTSYGCGGKGNFLNDNKIYIGMIDYSVNSNSIIPKEIQEKTNFRKNVQVPDEFLLSYNITKIGEMDESYIVKGNWDFNIPVSNEKVKGKVKEFDINADLKNVYKGAEISKLTITPINTQIQGKILTENYSGLEQLAFDVFDDKGRMLTPKGSEVDGGEANFNITDKNGKSNYYFSNEFKEIFEDTEEVTVIPYIEMMKSGTLPTETVTLNMKGETSLVSKDGEKLGVITKAQVLDGKTKLYIKSKYLTRLIPQEIIDNNTGEKIKIVDNEEDAWSFDTKTIRYIKETGELVVEYDKELKGDNYSISFNDPSKFYKCFENSELIIDLNK